VRIVLYGSTARGTNSDESDVDIAVFVHTRLRADEDDLLSDIIVDMNLKYDKVFSVIDIDEAVYQKWRFVTPFYQNVDREGIVLWKAA
jgi:predicted nucleotidyltransferase